MLSVQTEAAVRLAALVAAGHIREVQPTAEELTGRGATVEDLRETVYLVSLYCGFPRGVAALSAMATLPGGAHGDEPLDERGASRTRGEHTFHRIHLANAPRQLEMLERLHPDFADTVLTEAYGRVISRKFLPLAVRELIGVTALAVQGLEAQLRAHLLGALNSGASPEEVDEALRLAASVSRLDLGPALAQLEELARRASRDNPAGSPPSETRA